MQRAPVPTFDDRGTFCPAGGFHIDPWRPVPRAIVAHGHSDHARPGMAAYLATDVAAPVIRHRLGDIRIDTLPFGEPRRIGGATVSFHPAGHVPGSSRVRVGAGGRVWVVSGDHRTEADGLSEPWEAVPCHAVVSDSAFGLPVYRWRPQQEVMAEINRWWAANRDAGRFSVIGAHALGKAQRIQCRAAILDRRDSLRRTKRFLFNKLFTGGFRMGASRSPMTQAPAGATGRSAGFRRNRSSRSPSSGSGPAAGTGRGSRRGFRGWSAVGAARGRARSTRSTASARSSRRRAGALPRTPGYLRTENDGAALLFPRRGAYL